MKRALIAGLLLMVALPCLATPHYTIYNLKDVRGVEPQVIVPVETYVTRWEHASGYDQLVFTNEWPDNYYDKMKAEGSLFAIDMPGAPTGELWLSITQTHWMGWAGLTMETKCVESYRIQDPELGLQSRSRYDILGIANISRSYPAVGQIYVWGGRVSPRCVIGETYTIGLSSTPPPPFADGQESATVETVIDTER